MAQIPCLIIGVIARGIYVAVRALIDATALEKTLHDHLESYRINRINLRKEFFRVELSRIIEEVERHHGQVEYIADPVALQYLQSLEYAESEAA